MDTCCRCVLYQKLVFNMNFHRSFSDGLDVYWYYIISKIDYCLKLRSNLGIPDICYGHHSLHKFCTKVCLRQLSLAQPPAPSSKHHLSLRTYCSSNCFLTMCKCCIIHWCMQKMNSLDPNSFSSHTFHHSLCKFYIVSQNWYLKLSLIMSECC